MDGKDKHQLCTKSGYLGRRKEEEKGKTIQL